MIKYNSNILGATLFPAQQTILFYGGIFSQWAKCDFTLHIKGAGDYKLNCAEQGMMLHKAYRFGDEEVFDKILQSKDPREQKALGRCVKNFNAVVWDESAFNSVVGVNVAKFNSNSLWKEALILTDPYELVEASPYDRIWGIGYAVDAPNVFSEKDNWGINLLGKALMEVRRKFLYDEE